MRATATRISGEKKSTKKRISEPTWGEKEGERKNNGFSASDLGRANDKDESNDDDEEPPKK